MPTSPRRFRIVFRADSAVRPHNRLPSVRPVFSLSFRGGKAPVGIRIPAPAGAESLPPSEREVARSAGGRDVDPPHPRCSSVGGDAHIAPPFSHHIPGGQSRPPLQPPTERPPCFFSVIPRAQSARGNPHPRARRRGTPKPPSVREVARSAGGRDMPRQRRGIKQKGRSAPRRGVLLPPAAKVPKNAAKNYVFGFPYAPSPAAYLACFPTRTLYRINFL